MGDSPTPPTPADPNVVASNQQNLNIEAAQKAQQGSMVNQVGPHGSLSYNQTGTSADGTPLYTATTELSDPNKQLLSILQGTKSTAGTQGQNLISGANYGAAQPGDVIGNATGGLVKDAMEKQVAYLQPSFDYDRDRMATQLRNKGFNPGEPGYDRAMDNLLQSQGRTKTGFLSTIEPEMYKQAYQNYMTPASLGASLAGLGSPDTPTFRDTPGLSLQPANLVGATANAQDMAMKTYEAQNAKNASMMSGLFGIPTALLGGWAKSGGLSSLLGAGALEGAGGLGALAEIAPAALTMI